MRRPSRPNASPKVTPQKEKRTKREEVDLTVDSDDDNSLVAMSPPRTFPRPPAVKGSSRIPPVCIDLTTDSTDALYHNQPPPPAITVRKGDFTLQRSESARTILPPQAFTRIKTPTGQKTTPTIQDAIIGRKGDFPLQKTIQPPQAFKRIMTLTGQKPTPTIQDAISTACVKLGIKELKKFQGITLNHVCMGNHNVLLVAPTGQGKSLCYQIPAIVDNIRGGDKRVTLVVTPAKLLKDQHVAFLKSKGVNAVGSFLQAVNDQDPQNMRFKDNVDIVIVTPEALDNKRVKEGIKASCWPKLISRVVFDEAHMVRDSYRLRSYEFVCTIVRSWVLTGMKVTLLTATMTVEEEPWIKLMIAPGATWKSDRYSPDRHNLEYYFLKIPSEQHRKDFVIQQIKLIRSNPGDKKSGIIVYMNSIHTAESWSKKFEDEISEEIGLFVAKNNNEQAMKKWIGGNVNVAVATKCFGIGIDRPNVRVVFVCGLPLDLAELVQQFGRGGRDTIPTRVICIWSDKCMSTASFFIRAEKDVAKQQQMARDFSLMLWTATDNCTCRRIALFSHFVTGTLRACDQLQKGQLPCDCCADKRPIITVRVNLSVMGMTRDLQFSKSLAVRVKECCQNPKDQKEVERVRKAWLTLVLQRRIFFGLATAGFSSWFALTLSEQFGTTSTTVDVRERDEK